MASTDMEKVPSNDLRGLHRFITTHDSDGKAVLSKSISDEACEWQRFPRAAMFLGYTTKTFPVNMQNDLDIHEYSSMAQTPPGLFFPGSSICRILDMAPGEVSPMHRTQTVDYGVVLEGEVELILEDLEKPTERKLMGRGDICVQRATLHAWRNTSTTSWARMMFVLIACDKPVVNGFALGEDMERVDGTLKGMLKSAEVMA